MTRTLDNSTGRAPASAYVLMVATATIVTVAIGALAGWVRVDSDGFWFAFIVFALVCAPAAFSLAWTLFVAGHTVQPDRHQEDNVETQWYREATSAAFGDVLAVAGVAAAVTSIADVELDGRLVLIGVVALAMVDALVRLIVVRRRGA